VENPKVKRVLISVTDKTGVVEFARALSEEFGAQIISTGGTARVIAEAGNHDELLKLDGEYAKLYSNQFAGIAT